MAPFDFVELNAATSSHLNCYTVLTADRVSLCCNGLPFFSNTKAKMNVILSYNMLRTGGNQQSSNLIMWVEWTV